MPPVKDFKTLDLFAVPVPAAPIPGALDYRRAVCELVSTALGDTSKDRYDVGAQMSRLAGREVSKNMLDAYSSPAREEFNLPCYLVPALEVACGTHAITAWLAEVRGGRLLIGKEALHAELGKMQAMSDELRKRMRDLKLMMGEAE
jgi:hypothetical protein